MCSKSFFPAFFILVSIYCGSVLAQECHLDLKEDIGNMNQPIFLKNKELAIPDVNKSGGDTGVLTFKQSDTFTLACPGKNNAFVDFAAKETVQAQCKRNDDIVVDGETVSGDDLTCQDLSQSWIQGTGTTCGGNGTKGEIFDIGFQINSGLVKLFSVCHDIAAARTLYAQHKVYKSIKGAQQESKRPNFKVGDNKTFKGLPPNKAYNLKQQISVFETILGSRAEAEKMINKGSFLSRGHLAPDADFLFAAWQYATYYYSNVNPQFQTINAGSWLQFEKAVRDLAGKLEKTLDVTTGTHGILKVKDKPVYLDPRNQGIAVPEEFFKIVIEPISSRGIALVCSNNPFLDKAPQLLCKQDICGANKWPVLKDNFKKGYCYCCDVQEFARNVGFLPTFKTSSVLQFS
ncbi:hypothetical protein M8J77_016648 [Diaphorina citri]|nr:hypothetical protein M8J77_016648 [Diaphorina citri]